MSRPIQPDLGIPEEKRQSIIQRLNVLLADEHTLYVKLRNFHWNVVGPNFHSLHEMYEEQYTELAKVADEIAERLRGLGGQAIGTLAEFKEHARLQEEPGEWPDARGMNLRLLADHEQVAKHLREDIAYCSEDHAAEGIADMLVSVLKMHTNFAWMLRATLQRAG